MKAIYEKPKSNIMLNGENVKVFPLRSGPRQKCTALTTLFNMI